MRKVQFLFFDNFLRVLTQFKFLVGTLGTITCGIEIFQIFHIFSRS